MKKILTITASGQVIDRSTNLNINLGATPTTTIMGSATSGSFITITNNGLTWSGTTVSSYIAPTKPLDRPKYLSAVGGVLFKDQKSEGIKFQSVINGKFINIHNG